MTKLLILGFKSQIMKNMKDLENKDWISYLILIERYLERQTGEKTRK